MQQSRAEKVVAKALMTILIAVVLWLLLKPEERERRKYQEEPVVAESESQETTNAALVTPHDDPSNEAPLPTAPPLPVQTAETPSPKIPGRLSLEEIAKRRSEVKRVLSSVFTANASYFAEYNRYTTDLTAAGYMPQEGLLPAKFGFLSAYEPRGGREDNENPVRFSSDIFLNLQDEEGEPLYKLDAHSKDVDLSRYAKYCRDGCTASDTRFEVIAAFNLDEDDTLDVWIMDNNKELRHVVDDTKE